MDNGSSRYLARFLDDQALPPTCIATPKGSSLTAGLWFDESYGEPNSFEVVDASRASTAEQWKLSFSLSSLPTYLFPSLSSKPFASPYSSLSTCVHVHVYTCKQRLCEQTLTPIIEPLQARKQSSWESACMKAILMNWRMRSIEVCPLVATANYCGQRAK